MRGVLVRLGLRGGRMLLGREGGVGEVVDWLGEEECFTRFCAVCAQEGSFAWCGDAGGEIRVCLSCESRRRASRTEDRLASYPQWVLLTSQDHGTLPFRHCHLPARRYEAHHSRTIHHLIVSMC